MIYRLQWLCGLSRLEGLCRLARLCAEFDANRTRSPVVGRDGSRRHHSRTQGRLIDGPNLSQGDSCRKITAVSRSTTFFSGPYRHGHFPSPPVSRLGRPAGARGDGVGAGHDPGLLFRDGSHPGRSGLLCESARDRLHVLRTREAEHGLAGPVLDASRGHRFRGHAGDTGGLSSGMPVPGPGARVPGPEAGAADRSGAFGDRARRPGTLRPRCVGAARGPRNRPRPASRPLPAFSALSPHLPPTDLILPRATIAPCAGSALAGSFRHPSSDAAHPRHSSQSR